MVERDGWETQVRGDLFIHLVVFRLIFVNLLV